MRITVEQLYTAIALALAMSVPAPAWAFDAGSTGVNGDFLPTVDTALQLPADGIFNFTTVNVPAGVTVTFTRNSANTPVIIRASGDVTIAGTVDASGSPSGAVGSAGDGNLADDGLPGTGGPGGFDGGRGGDGVSAGRGSYGLGPGGGPGGNGLDAWNNNRCGGAGGSYGSVGEMGNNRNNVGTRNGTCDGGKAAAYGSTLLIPFVGGSGGGGGQGGSSLPGSGGGGGGGAILIASSGTVNITGSVLANGGASGQMTGTNCGTTGGGGSGGALRIMATTISGDGTISAKGGSPGILCNGLLETVGFNDSDPGGFGGAGRVRLEADTLTRTAGTTPPAAVAIPGAVFVPGIPTLRFVSVGGVVAPASPTGTSDVVLPRTTVNPVTVEFAATGIPLGNTVSLTVKTDSATPTVVTSTQLSGTTANSTASASVNLPAGPSVLQATTSFTIVASLGQELGNQFANGERVERVTLSAALNGPSMMTLTTVSGKEFTVPARTAAGIL